MRTYGHHCQLARGLDVIGDRWVLLIVRELLLGPRRYGELLDGLPGIATNLLAERLRSMETNGLVAKSEDDRYVLTERGAELREVVYAIGRWAHPLMEESSADETFRGEWIAHPIASMFAGDDDTRPGLTVEVRSATEPITVRSSGGRVTVERGSAVAPDLVLTGRPDTIVDLFAHRVSVAEAKASGLAVTGDPRPLRKLRPMTSGTPRR